MYCDFWGRERRQMIKMKERKNSHKKRDILPYAFPFTTKRNCEVPTLP